MPGSHPRGASSDGGARAAGGDGGARAAGDDGGTPAWLRTVGRRDPTPEGHPATAGLREAAAGLGLRLATILSFGDHDDAASDASDDSFEFAFARPLATVPGTSALADDLFAHGCIVPAYPVFHRRQDQDDHTSSASAATAPPSPETYCAWTPRSTPGSPARELPPAAFPKSTSTGQASSAVHRFRLRDLVGYGAGRRSHSNGREKFLFLQPKPKTTIPVATSTAAAAKKTHSHLHL